MSGPMVEENLICDFCKKFVDLVYFHEGKEICGECHWPILQKIRANKEKAMDMCSEGNNGPDS